MLVEAHEGVDGEHGERGERWGASEEEEVTATKRGEQWRSRVLAKAREQGRVAR